MKLRDVVTRTVLLAAFAALVAAEDGALNLGFLSPEDRRALADGQLVTKVVDTEDRTEVLSVAALRGPIDPATFVKIAQDARGFGRVEDSLGEGRLSAPPRTADFASLHLDDRDLAALAKCRIGDCRVRLTATAIGRFEKIDWSADDSATRAEAAFREMLVEEGTQYLAHGNQGLPDYADGPNAPARASGLSELLRRPFDPLDDAGGLRDYLQGSPGGRPHLVDEFLAWRKDRFWRKSVIGLYHVTIWRSSEAHLERVVVATKLIYASHYYESAVEAVELARAGRADADVTFLSRVRADIRPSGFTWIERALLRRLVRGRLINQFDSVRMRLVAPPAVARVQEGP